MEEEAAELPQQRNPSRISPLCCLHSAWQVFLASKPTFHLVYFTKIIFLILFFPVHIFLATVPRGIVTGCAVAFDTSPVGSSPKLGSGREAGELQTRAPAAGDVRADAARGENGPASLGRPRMPPAVLGG